MNISDLFKEEFEEAAGRQVRISDLKFRQAYEEKSIRVERTVNRIRFLLGFMFLVTGFSSYKNNSSPPVYQGVIGCAIVYLISTFCWEIYLRNAVYKKWIKYLTTATDILVIFTAKYFMHFDYFAGWGLAIKDPATFVSYFLMINLAGLRLDRRFSVFTGGLTVASFLALLLMGLASGTVSFTSDPSLAYDPKYLRASVELSKILFLIAASAIIVYLSGDTRRFLSQLSVSETRTQHNLKVMGEILQHTEEVSVRLRDLMKGLVIQADSVQASVNDQKIFFEKDLDTVKSMMQESREINLVINSQLGMLEKISSRVDSLLSVADQVKKESTESVSKAVQVKKIITEGQVFLENAMSSVQDMKAQSEKILNISRTINEIAESTSLLALNASIEAARAGVNGRGFAVVASEVQKLADRSINSSKEIHTIINATVKNIDRSSSMIQETSKQLEVIAEAVKENEVFLGGLSENAVKQGKLSFAIKSDVENIKEIGESVLSLTVGQDENLSAFSERNKKKLEMTAKSEELVNRLEEITKEMGLYSSKLYDLVKERDRLISEDKRMHQN